MLFTDICVDNADANCATLKFIICGDPDGALKLCPKTCGICSEYIFCFLLMSIWPDLNEVSVLNVSTSYLYNYVN